jgi:hypothetical protein
MKDITIQMPDGGPVYAETNLNNFIVEPWNAISSIVLILPAIYFIFQLKKRYRENGFFIVLSALLFLGGIGSTLYHAFRSDPLLLALDVVPIQLLSLLIIVYFWYKVLKSRTKVILVLGAFILTKVYIYMSLSGSDLMNLSYLVNGIMMFLPILIYLINTSFRKAGYVYLSCTLFFLSLVCRQIDINTVSVFPMGTHWLWHILSAGGSLFMSLYLLFMPKETYVAASLDEDEDLTLIPGVKPGE